MCQYFFFAALNNWECSNFFYSRALTPLLTSFQTTHSIFCWIFYSDMWLNFGPAGVNFRRYEMASKTIAKGCLPSFRQKRTNIALNNWYTTATDVASQSSGFGSSKERFMEGYGNISVIATLWECKKKDTIIHTCPLNKKSKNASIIMYAKTYNDKFYHKMID